jgi:hypothetical protein
MYRSIALLIVAVFMSCVLLPASATGVFKWVDTKGITHYSDEAPASSTTQVTLIEVPATQAVAFDVENDYYSIANQWTRFHEELIKREKIKLEKTRQEAALQPIVPQIVYINEPNANRYGVAYPGFSHRKYGRSRYHYKSRHYPGYGRKKHLQWKRSAKLPGTSIRRSSYGHRAASGLIFNIR